MSEEKESAPNPPKEESKEESKILAPPMQDGGINEIMDAPSPVVEREEVEKMKFGKRPGEVDLDADSPKIIEEWKGILSDYEKYRKKHESKLKKLIRLGIPNVLRGQGWLAFSGIQDKINPSEIEELLAKHKSLSPSTHTHYGGSIDRDISRTFPDYAMFKDGNYGACELKRVLIAYAIKHPEIGYCQGMNFVVGILLQYLNETEAFFMLENIIHNPKYDMQRMYNDSLYKLHLCVYQFHGIMDRFIPRVKKHFQDLSIDPLIFISEWFIPLYSRTFPLGFVVRIWDAYFFEGIKILFRIGIALLKINENQLLTYDLEGVMIFFKTLPQRVTVATVLECAYSLSLSHRHLDHYQREYEKLHAADEK